MKRKIRCEHCGKHFQAGEDITICEDCINAQLEGSS